MPIDPENKITTVKQFPLERKKIMKKFIASEIGYIIMFLFLGFLGLIIGLIPILAFFPGALWLVAVLVIGFILLFLVVTGVNWWYQVKYYETYYYDIRQNFLVIKKGVFMPTETILPFEKLQDVYLDQDLFDKIFGLWDLHVSTATFMSGYNAHIDGVSIANGEAMRELLLEKIKSKSK